MAPSGGAHTRDVFHFFYSTFIENPLCVSHIYTVIAHIQWERRPDKDLVSPYEWLELPCLVGLGGQVKLREEREMFSMEIRTKKQILAYDLPTPSRDNLFLSVTL